MIDLVQSGFLGQVHHLGYATASISSEVEYFQKLGYNVEGEIFKDPTQGIAGCFMNGPGPRIELLENLPDSNTLTPWIKAGIKIYHFAYLVSDMRIAISWAKENRGKIIVGPVAAVAFNGRQIAFVMFRHGMMIEFVESNLTLPGETR